ncbi:MAG: ABC transporter permease subunit [Chloroflexota bacterium]
MRNAWIIARREFRQYFVSPVAYAVAAMILLILGGIFAINMYVGMMTGQVNPDGRMVVGPLVTILIFAIPAITMRLLADEHRMGTIELLLTAPLRDWELVLGKWLGAMGFMLVILAATWVYPLILQRLTTPGIDQGALVSAYVGLILLVSAVVALGVLISSLFTSPVPAFFTTLGLLLILWIVGNFAQGSGGVSDILRYLSLIDHYYGNLYRGVLDLSDSIYFLSLTALALFLGSQVVEARRWR